jgi:hypothetical protein
MEQSFGSDFSDVRVHQGAAASAMGAVAATQGSNVAFAPTAIGGADGLVGHEAAHVIQQRAGLFANQY